MGAGEGGRAELVHVRAFSWVASVLPEAIAWAAMLGTIAVFLSAYNIPVSFHILMRVVAGNSIANVSSVTPGGAGVVQGFNVLSLKGITSTSNATAYSVAEQLVTTAWGILFAIVLAGLGFRLVRRQDARRAVLLSKRGEKNAERCGGAQGQAPRRCAFWHVI